MARTAPTLNPATELKILDIAQASAAHLAAIRVGRHPRLKRSLAWCPLQDGLTYRFEDFLDTQILAAFWPGGQPCTDFTEAERRVARLEGIASAEALVRLAALRSAA